MVARLFQQFFGGLLQVAFGLVRALFQGFLKAPQSALSPIQIRSATPREVDGVHEVVLGRTPSSEQTHRYWAAERNGLVIGALTAVADEGWELRDLAVLPQYDAIEIGSALLRHAEAELEGPLWSATPQIPEVFRTWQDDGTGVLRWPG